MYAQTEWFDRVTEWENRFTEVDNPDGSICLHARTIEFEHPVSHIQIRVKAPLPDLPLWHKFVLF